MSSFEPVVLIYGSPQSVASAHLRLPVSSLFAFDIKSLEDILNTPPPLSNPCLNRYFVILLESIHPNLLTQLQSNHRIISIYDKEKLFDCNHEENNQMINSYRQITLDLTNDIIRFLTSEGKKQIKLERLSLVKIYYQQARILKEWSMSLFKAEPCHILLVSLNSTKQNIDNAQQRLEQICTKLGYNSTIIRQLSDYIPSSDRHSSLFPYSKLFFNHENPLYICKMLKKLSPIRLYLYGNEFSICSEWSKLMIESEIDLMDDEDNWISFIENELIDTEVKWNCAFTFAREWKVPRISPINIDELDGNPRFSSALRRAKITFTERQIEVTSNIFDWYNKCLERGYFHTEPKMVFVEELLKVQNRPKSVDELMLSHRFGRLFSFDYPFSNYYNTKPISFIWLDEMSSDPVFDVEFDQIKNRSQWKFFHDIDQCTDFIKRQINSQHYIFLVVSEIFGQRIFSTESYLTKEIFAIYIYSTEYYSEIEWTRNYPKIHGVYQDPFKLVRHIRKDYKQLQNSLGIYNTNSSDISIINEENKIFQNCEEFQSIPLTVYNNEEPDLFLDNQERIDGLFSMTHTDQSKSEMIKEFRRIYQDNEIVLIEINEFEILYESNSSIYWYTRDSFVCRVINQSLRLNHFQTIFKLRHILGDIYSLLNQSDFSSEKDSSEIYYRGQLMSKKEFDYFKQIQGEILSINTFFSTTLSLQVALMYTGKSSNENDDHLTSIIFSIEKHSSIKTRPYSNISHYSLFPDEDETLFSMGTIFRIGTISPLANSDNVWIIQLILIDQNNYQLKQTTS